MFAQRWLTSFRREKRIRGRKADAVAEQVKQLLQTEHQKLILMVRN